MGDEEKPLIDKQQHIEQLYINYIKCYYSKCTN